EAGAIDFEWLKNHVAVGQDDRRTPLLDVFNYFHRIGKKALGERIGDQKLRNGKQVRRARMLDAVTLQRAKVIRVTQSGSQLLKDLPILLSPIRTDLTDEVALQICCDPIIVQERVVHVE